VLANEIDAKTAHALAQAGELTIIDIRRPAEWRKTGVPEGSVGISLQNFYRKIRGQFPGDVLAAVGGDKADLRKWGSISAGVGVTTGGWVFPCS